MRQRRDIGLAIIGSGRIGSLRARLASRHPAVRFLGVADQRAGTARDLADQVNADAWAADGEELIQDRRVDAVIVATSEDQHVAPVLTALDAGHDVLVEKPIALDTEASSRMVAVAAAGRGTLRVGYSRRYRRRYLVAKEQLVRGRLGAVLGATARVYNSRAQALAMLERNPAATPVVDALTYYVDLMNWFLAGRRVEEVSALGQHGVLAAAGHDVDDVTWALLRYDDGAAVNLGVSYALPASFPARGHAARVELLGSDGVIILDDDHADQIMVSEHDVPHVYLPDDTAGTVFLSSGTPGDWALDELVGPLAAETRAWLDHLATGQPCHLATAEEAHATLEVTLAIERAARSGSKVTLRRDLGGTPAS